MSINIFLGKHIEFVYFYIFLPQQLNPRVQLSELSFESKIPFFHLTVDSSMLQTIDLFLIESNIREIINVNVTNVKGLTTLDILDIVIEDSHYVRIRVISVFLHTY